MLYRDMLMLLGFQSTTTGIADLDSYAGHHVPSTQKEMLPACDSQVIL